MEGQAVLHIHRTLPCKSLIFILLPIPRAIFNTLPEHVELIVALLLQDITLNKALEKRHARKVAQEAP